MNTTEQTKEMLKQYIDRIQQLDDEKSNIQADIRDIFVEAKGNGFDPKIMRQVLKLSKMNKADRAEQEELLDLYMKAVGIKD